MLEPDLPPQLDEVVQAPEVAVLVVPLHPLGAVVDGHALCERDRLAKVDEVDAAQVRAVVDKEEGAPYYLWREIRLQRYTAKPRI